MNTSPKRYNEALKGCPELTMEVNVLKSFQFIYIKMSLTITSN